MVELLSPAKNKEYGIEAINHGADAVYIGADAFGARIGAKNALNDIDALVTYAHLYHCKVFVTINTLLFDNELSAAKSLIGELYNMGVDAIITQDQGLINSCLPPIQLHASTQCHSTNWEQVKFLEQVGFKRVILARELSIEQIRDIRAKTTVELETFIHGALCVSYSGQCYMSQYLNSRSGNRGCCSQPCRSSYDLYNTAGEKLLSNKHLLSLRDFNASRHILALIKAGVNSFKIEGRLKDIAYLKNITAYYRQLIDNMNCGHVSSGKITYYFTPNVEYTFNRGYTDYFLQKRQPMASFDTPKSLGEEIGVIEQCSKNKLIVKSNKQISNGDGLCCLDTSGHLIGFSVNNITQNIIIANHPIATHPHSKIWRNYNHAFEKVLQGMSAKRKIEVSLSFSETPNGFAIQIVDEDNIMSLTEMVYEKVISTDQEKMSSILKKQLQKLGDTPFYTNDIIDNTKGTYHLSIASVNALRRRATQAHQEKRISRFAPIDSPVLTKNNIPFPREEVNYTANITNHQAEKFYIDHGAQIKEWGLDYTKDFDGKALMTTKYCLRYELGCCLKHKNTHKPIISLQPSDQLILHNNGRWLKLQFNCEACEMQIFSYKK
ncbi:MAG: U32 family peptidase [Bacteroidales bacterium]|nr:U32 family peptidase [Bacteroidales bacterium]